MEPRFFAGSTMAHRHDYEDLLGTLKKAERAMADLDLSNFKLLQYGEVLYCAQCGANLRRFYGRDGGVLRDDDFVARLVSA